MYGGIPAGVIDDLIAMFLDWKAAHSTLWGVIVVRDSALLSPFGASSVLPDGSTTYPVGNWGYVIAPATGLPTRDPRLQFIYDLGQG